MAKHSLRAKSPRDNDMEAVADQPAVRDLRKDRPKAPTVDSSVAQGKRLKRARERFYKTASLAAAEMGIAGPTYLAHENGTRQIRSDMARFYGSRFKVSPDWLLFEVGSGPGEVNAASASPDTTLLPMANGLIVPRANAFAGLDLLLRELKVARAAGNAFVPINPRVKEPGLLPPASMTDGWITELAQPSPMGGFGSECYVAVSSDITLVLRDIFRMPLTIAAERPRLFTVRLPLQGELFPGHHVFVDPDETHVEDEKMFLVTRQSGSLEPACIARDAASGRTLIGRSFARPPTDFDESCTQIVGRIVTLLKPLVDAEVHEVADRMFRAGVAA